MTTLFISSHPLVQHKLTLLRDAQTTPQLFRDLVREITIPLIYEATMDLETLPVTVETPLASAPGRRLSAEVSLVPILRAGLGMVEGAWQLLPRAEVWHIGLARDEQTLKPVEYYTHRPVSPVADVCLILDPMLATGGSATAAADILKRWGAERIKFVGIIASRYGVEQLSQAHPDVPIYVGAVDEELNDVGYIVPGLGDAGDRMFGTG
jgi:uracil phosphoribosyltransferase